MNYSITLSFDLLDLQKLQHHFHTNTILKNKIDSLNYNSGNRLLDCLLSTELDQTDISNITDLLSTYVNVYDDIYKVSNIGFQKMEFTNTEFTTVFVYNYQYTADWVLDHVKITTNTINSTDLDYVLRIVNIDQNEIIAQKTCNVNNDGIDVDIILFNENLIFNNDTQNLEIQLKLVNPGVISLLSVNFVYKASI
jgi:hypothetical protein